MAKLQPEKGKSGSLKEGFIPPKGTRKMYHVEIISRSIGPDQEVIENRRQQCFNQRDFDQFKENAVKIGASKWELIWDPTVYGQPE